MIYYGDSTSGIIDVLLGSLDACLASLPARDVDPNVQRLQMCSL